MNEILIVEDDGRIREVLTEILEMEGYTVSCAANGLEALNHLRTHADLPSLILLDVMMPLMDGYQFRNEQTQDPRLKDIPVVVITADGHASQKAKKMGTEGWVKKPVELDLFLDTIRRYCA